jgi:hypothetical protein
MTLMTLARRRVASGHVYLDFAILIIILVAAAAFTLSGVQKGSLALTLFGAWGLAVGLAFPAGLLLDRACEALGAKAPEFAPGVFVVFALAGSLAGAVWAFERRSFWPALAGFAAGCAVGVAAGPQAKRFPRARDLVGDAASEGVMATLIAYLLIPLAYLLYRALVLPLFELGLSDGLKISLVMAGLAAAVAAFFWALDKFQAFRKIASAALLFGLLFGFSAFLTVLFMPSQGSSLGTLYAALGAEALASGAFSAYIAFRKTKGP